MGLSYLSSITSHFLNVLHWMVVNTNGDTVNQVAAKGDSHATTTTPFVDDPFRYLRFRANFRDQLENRASLTDNEKMNYLMTYTYYWESEGSLALKW